VLLALFDNSITLPVDGVDSTFITKSLSVDTGVIKIIDDGII
jgi:hypothetical protein